MYKKGMLHKDTFDGKVILITGGGSGLGKSIGEYLLELGASIIITSRKMEVLEKTSNELSQQFPDKIFPISGDVRNIEDVENVINLGYEHFGTIDGLLNNAAGNFISVITPRACRIRCHLSHLILSYLADKIKETTTCYGSLHYYTTI